MPSAGLAEQPKWFLGRHWASAVVLLITLVAAAFRIIAYGDSRLSVATMDTQSYMDHAAGLVFSASAFSGERLLTTGLLYRLWSADDCSLEFVSIPAIGRESNRGIQSCFAGLATSQVALSIIGWSIFIVSFASTLTHPLSQVIAALVLSIFAFTPQLADWDSILSSESLAFSLFAMSLGIGFLTIKEDSHTAMTSWNRRKTAALTFCTLVCIFLWMLVRDPHVYVGFVLFTMVFITAMISRPRRTGLMLVAGSTLVGCLLVQAASYDSGRWRIPLSNAFKEYILPYPARVSALQVLGMPEPGSQAYDAWFAQSAPGSYTTFLGMHPGFVATTLFNHLNFLFAENSQPYFKTPDLPLRSVALTVGDLVHAKSTVVLTLDLLMVLCLVAARERFRSLTAWRMSLLMAGLLVSAWLTLVLTFFADTIGVERHVLLSLVLFRLLLWLCTVMIIDTTFGPPQSVVST